MAIHISVDSRNITKNEAESLATFFENLATSAPVERPSYGNAVAPSAPAPFTESAPVGVYRVKNETNAPTVVEEVEEEELPDLSEDEPKATDSLVEEQNELDVNGIPWDKRIHSGKPTKNADGSWKKRRSVDDAVFNTVVAELKGEVAETKTEVVPDQSQVGFTPNQSHVGFQQVQPEQPAQPEQTALTWPQVLQRISAISATQDTINTGMAAVGLAGRPLPELVNSPDKFDFFLSSIGA